MATRAKGTRRRSAPRREAEWTLKDRKRDMALNAALSGQGAGDPEGGGAPTCDPRLLP